MIVGQGEKYEKAKNFALLVTTISGAVIGVACAVKEVIAARKAFLARNNSDEKPKKEEEA